MRNRIESFAWRLGAYIVVAAGAYTLEHITEVTSSPAVIAIVALVTGEVTKYFNKKHGE